MASLKKIDQPAASAEPYLEMGCPIVLLAGPGTGKTYQLAKRIHALVDNHGVLPEQITVMTFTREAARSMRGRLKERGKPEYTEPSKRPKSIQTMHSLGYKIINENASSLGLKPEVVVVRDRLLKGALMRDAACLVGCSEAEGKTALKDKEQANVTASGASKKAQGKYAELLRACNAVDFDDQIGIACEVLESHADVLSQYQASARHLLVDEYQDINADQHRLITLLSRGQVDGLFVVGDDDQSIYGFRGATPEYIRSFTSNYPEGKVLQLQESRRCLRNILDSAISIVEKYDTGRSTKLLPTYTQTDKGMVGVWSCPSETREAELIAKSAYSKLANAEAESIFILVPNKNYVKAISDALRSGGVDHEVGTGSEPVQEWDALSVIRSWLTTRADIFTRHVIELVVCSTVSGMPGPRVRKEEKRKLRDAYIISIAELWEPILNGGQSLEESLEAAAKKNKLMKEIWKPLQRLRQSYETEDVPAFMDAVRGGLALFGTVEEFYKCLETLEGRTPAREVIKTAVRILTSRNSKGLEADCVYIVGLEDNCIPRDLTDADGTAEEARLMFVAMTRAKRELHLLHARKRTGASSYKPHSHKLGPSAFINALPEAKIEKTYVQPAKAKKKSRG